MTYFAYERGQVSKVENLKSDLSVISSFEYERDCMGNPLSILREDGSVNYYDYDRRYQLTSEIQVDDQGETLYAWEWEYDKAGNRTLQVFNGEPTYYEYNAGNELVTETTGGLTTYYGYDHRGNQTVKQAPEGTTYFQYDHRNLLTRIDLPDATSNEFGYDGDSKRVWVNDSQGARRMIYQGPDMLRLFQEKDVVGQTVAQYTMGLGLESMRRGEASSFYHYDALGSTHQLTDAAEAVTDTYRYNAWGEGLGQTGTTVNAHRYVGRERYYRGPSGALHLLGLRHLAECQGRFITPDPMRQGSNWWLYVGNAPTLSVDPNGLDLTVRTCCVPACLTSIKARLEHESKRHNDFYANIRAIMRDVMREYPVEQALPAHYQRIKPGLADEEITWIFISDTHVGELVLREHTSGLTTYSTEMFIERCQVF